MSLTYHLRLVWKFKDINLKSPESSRKYCWICNLFLNGFYLVYLLKVCLSPTAKYKEMKLLFICWKYLQVERK